MSHSITSSAAASQIDRYGETKAAFAVCRLIDQLEYLLDCTHRNVSGTASPSEDAVDIGRRLHRTRKSAVSTPVGHEAANLGVFVEPECRLLAAR